MANFTGTNAADNFVGADNVADTFSFALGNLQANDTVSGGNGAVSDILRLTTGGTLPADRLAGVSGIETVELAAAGNTITLTQALAATASGQTMTMIGAGGNDFIDATAFVAAQSLIARSGGGADTLKGGAGADQFEFNVAQLTGADAADGGAGFDTLRFLTAGEIAAAALTGVQGIERVELAAAGSVIALSSAFVGTSQNGRVVVTAGAGNDVIDGSGLGDFVAVVTESGGGADRVLGGDGADTFRFAAAQFTSADTVAGAGGSDTLQFQTAGVITAAELVNVSGVGRIILAEAGNTLTIDDAFAAAGDSISVFVQGTGAGNDIVNAADVTNEFIEFTLGGGSDRFTGGGGNDDFRVGAGVLNAADTIDGGDGNDTLRLITQGNAGAAKLANVVSIETIILADGAAGNRLQLSADYQRNSSGDEVIRVVGGSGNDTVDASGFGVNKPGLDVFASLRVNAGGGIDDLTGGGTDDAFVFFMPELTGADRVTGGGGLRDALILLGNGQIQAAAFAGVAGVERIDLTLATGDTDTGINGAMVAASDELRTLTVLGNGSANRVATANVAQGDTVQFVAGLGSDSMIGGGANDVFEIAATQVGADDAFSAGNGINDALRLTGSGTVNAAQLVNVLDGVEVLAVSAGSVAEIIVAPTPGSATTLRLDNTALDDGAKLRIESKGSDVIDLGAVGAGRILSVIAGGGSDNLIGSAGADVFAFEVALLSTVPVNSFPQGGDLVDGRGGIDELAFTTGGTINSSALSRVESMEKFVLSDAGNTLVLNDEVLANNRISSLFFVESGTGDDVVIMPSQNTSRLVFTSGGGSDLVFGGAGADSFRFGSSLDANDFIDGGTGNDRLSLVDTSFNFDGTARNSIRSIETVSLSSSDDGTIETLTIDLDDVLSIKARNTNVLGTAFDDVLIINGNDADDRVVIDTSPGGPDLTVEGDFAAGNDVFRFFTAGNSGAVVLAVDRELLS